MARARARRELRVQFLRGHTHVLVVGLHHLIVRVSIQAAAGGMLKPVEHAVLRICAHFLLLASITRLRQHQVILCLNRVPIHTQRAPGHVRWYRMTIELVRLGCVLIHSIDWKCAFECRHFFL